MRISNTRRWQINNLISTLQLIIQKWFGWNLIIICTSVARVFEFHIPAYLAQMMMYALLIIVVNISIDFSFGIPHRV